MHTLTHAHTHTHIHTHIHTHACTYTCINIIKNTRVYYKIIHNKPLCKKVCNQTLFQPVHVIQKEYQSLKILQAFYSVECYLYYKIMTIEYNEKQYAYAVYIYVHLFHR